MFRHFDVSRCVIALAWIGGCAQGGSDQMGTGPAQARTSQKGPVQVTFTVTPTDLDFSQRAEARLEIVSEPGVRVQVYDYGRAIRDSEHRFEIGVVHSESTPPTPAIDGKLISTHRYELQFFLPGEYELPPVTLTFVDQRGEIDDTQPDRDTAEPAVQKLQSGSLTITARDESGRQLSAEELRTIKTLAPIELPTIWTRWRRLGPPIAALAIAAMVLFVAPLRRLLARCLVGRRWERVTVVSAYEWAKRQLAALFAEDLVGKGRFREFYYRISSILRSYIERRYGVFAREMTTQEFLKEVATDRRFGPETVTELKRLLSACDLVKYARHEPTSAESEGALMAAKTYVERTRERPPSADAARRADRPIAEEHVA